MKIPLRYLPFSLTKKDKKKQVKMLKLSRVNYKNNKSNHIKYAQKIYNIKSIIPNKQLSLKTGCSLSSLREIVRKGEGAYYSSGSRPNQTAQSWGFARLASSITAGKSASVDFDILEKGCNHNKKAYKLALQSRKKYKFGRSKTRKIVT